MLENTKGMAVVGEVPTTHDLDTELLSSATEKTVRIVPWVVTELSFSLVATGHLTDDS